MSVVTDLTPQTAGGGRKRALQKTASKHHSWTIVIGMALLPVMGRGLGDILDDGPFDPTVYSLVLLAMVVVAVAATLTPTRRALKVDPAAALRYE